MTPFVYQQCDLKDNYLECLFLQIFTEVEEKDEESVFMCMYVCKRVYVCIYVRDIWNFFFTSTGNNSSFQPFFVNIAKWTLGF